ncbi:3'-5' exonuclease [Microbacterium sp.]
MNDAAHAFGSHLPEPQARQADVIYLNADRDQVVLGTAGSGKTLMALHRAFFLSNPNLEHGGPTLLVTFNKALTSNLAYLAGAQTKNLHIRNYHLVARGYLSSQGLMGYGDVLDWSARTRAVRTAIERLSAAGETNEILKRPPEFFEDELDWISGHGHRTKEQYLAAERKGRLDPLQPTQRETMWALRAAYHDRRTELGRKYDWDELASAMRAALAIDESPRMYRHVVIDEAQDLPPEALRSLRDLIPSNGTVTLFADYAQQLYGQRTSWLSCGLHIIREERFEENYRNSPGIAKLAIATAALPHFRDHADLVEPSAPATSGIQPTLYRAANTPAELSAVRAQATQFAKNGRAAILTRTPAEARKAAAGLNYSELSEHSWSAESGLYIGTLYAAKGLEFDAVILPFMGSDLAPEPGHVASFGLDEAMERDSRLVYVGITRARSELLVTYQGQLSPLLPPPASGLWTVTGSTQ